MGQETDVNPFIERPEQHSAGAANELYCWMPDTVRECNGSCMAFTPNEDGGECCAVLQVIKSLGSVAEAYISAAQIPAKRAAALKAELEKLPPPPKVR